jgi:predicted TIM-barrel fold metal-dependent hydrolase
MPIQDAHTHFFGRPFFDGLAALSPRKDEPGLVEAVAGKAGLQLPDADPAQHAARWIGEMDKHGVARMVSFASLPGEAEAVAAAARASKGRLIPYTIVNPTDAKAPAFTERALGTLGFRGLLTFPAMHHFRPGDACMQPVLELAQKHKAPVLVHCGLLRVKLRDAFGIPRPYDLSFADPLHVVAAANRFRDVSFVLPHFGGGLLQNALLAGAQCENVLLDTSSSNDWMATLQPRPSLAYVFRAALGVFGAERLLFGTDSSTFPRGWRADLRDAQLSALEQAGASSTQMDAILGGNLARLLPAS